MNKYRLKTDTVHDEHGIPHTVYGIDIPTEQIAVSDIFYHKTEAKAFIKKCNKLDLSPLHLPDVIDDLL